MMNSQSLESPRDETEECEGRVDEGLLYVNAGFDPVLAELTVTPDREGNAACPCCQGRGEHEAVH